MREKNRKLVKHFFLSFASLSLLSHSLGRKNNALHFKTQWNKQKNRSNHKPLWKLKPVQWNAAKNKPCRQIWPAQHKRMANFRARKLIWIASFWIEQLFSFDLYEINYWPKIRVEQFDFFESRETLKQETRIQTRNATHFLRRQTCYVLEWLQSNYFYKNVNLHITTTGLQRVSLDQSFSFFPSFLWIDSINCFFAAKKYWWPFSIKLLCHREFKALVQLG